MRDSPAFDDEDLWFPAHMSVGDSFTRPLTADGAALDDDGIGLPRQRNRTGGSDKGPRPPKKGGVKASSWLWLTLWGAAAVGIAGYAARKEIATELVQNWLKGQGVPSRLHFDTLSFGHATGSIVLGDGKRPDVSAGRFDVDYSLNPFASGGLPMARLNSAHVDQVSVRISLKNGRLGFGTLDRIVHQAMTAPKTPGAPPKDIIINNAVITVDSDYGQFIGKGGATLHDGRLSYLTLKLPPAHLSGAKGEGVFGGGEVLVKGAGDARLQVEARLTAAAMRLRQDNFAEGAAAGTIDLKDGRIDVSARVPYAADGSFTGPVSGTVAVAAQSLRSQTVDAAGVDGRIAFDGRLSQGAAFAGTTDINAHAGRLKTGASDVRAADVSAHALKVQAAQTGVTVHGAFDAEAGNFAQSGMTVRAAHLHADRSELTADAGGLHADFAGRATVGHTAYGDAALDAVNAAYDATAQSDAVTGAWTLKLQTTTLSGQGHYGGLHAAVRGRTPGDGLYELDRGLERFALRGRGFNLDMSGGGGASDFNVRLASPLQADLAGGGTLVVTPQPGKPLLASHALGGFGLSLGGARQPRVNLTLEGLGFGRNGALSGDYALDGRFTMVPVTDAQVTAKGRLVARDGLALTLAGPLTFKAAAADLGDRFEHLSGTLTQTGDAFAGFDSTGWRVNGAFHGLSMSAPKESLTFTGGQGRLSAFALAGSDAIGLKATLDTATLDDAMPDDARRFYPLVMSGDLAQDAHALSGRFIAATPGFKTNGKPTPVVAVTLDNDPRTQKGQLGLHTLDLTFTPNGLQPKDLSQMGTAFLSKDVSGKLSFDGAFRWDHDKTTSGGVLKVDGLNFTGAIGTAQKLQGEIDFTSLAPLESRPNQVLGIYRMEVGLPLSDLAMSLQFQGDRIAIEKASVQTPGGEVRLEPTSIAFDPKVPIDGAASFDGLDFGKVVAATGLAQSMTFEGKLSGRVPFSILGGHIGFSGGHMQADTPGLISIRRQAITGVQASGTLTDGKTATTAVPADFNPFQDMAYQAMEHLHYDQLDARINSQDGGILDTVFHIKGRFDPPVPQKAIVSVSDYISGAWMHKPLNLPSGTPVELYLDVPVNLDSILNDLSAFSGK